jgi:hypothetical protein
MGLRTLWRYYLPVTDLKRSDTFCGGMLGPLGKSERWHFKAHARLQAFSRPTAVLQQ